MDDDTSVFSGVTAPSIGGESITSALSGSIQYKVTVSAPSNPIAAVRITDISITGTADDVKGISTGAVTIGIASSIPSSGTWNLATGDVYVNFPLYVSYENLDFSNFLAIIGEPVPPFSFNVPFSGSYTGSLPTEDDPYSSGLLSLSAVIDTVHSPGINVTVNVNVNVNTTPEPSSVVLFSSGCLPLIGMTARRRKSLIGRKQSAEKGAGLNS